MREFEQLPRGIGQNATQSDKASRITWTAPEGLHQTAKWAYDETRFLVGMDRQGNLIGLDDDRHQATVAGSRGGKGISVILPNLARYAGSMVVLDPKGENATLTAERRGLGRSVPAGGMGQTIIALDPFMTADIDPAYRANFNPMDTLDVQDEDTFVDDCDSIADALVVSDGKNSNDHWNSSARLVLRGVIAWVASAPFGSRDLGEVRRLLHLPLDKFDDLLADMIDTPKRAFGVPAEMASALLGMGSDEQGSVLSTVRTNILFLSSPPMEKMLRSGGRQPDLKAWKFGGCTIYLCLPAGRLHRHARFFRLLLNRLFAAVESTPKKGKIPAIIMLDEMHVLGHMAQLETAAGFIAGYGVKIHSIWQDFTQAEGIYGKRWQTFLGNASLFQSFALNDMKTLQYVSDRLGGSSVVSVTQSETTLGKAARGFDGISQTTQMIPLLSPSEVAEEFSRQGMAQCVMYPGASPIWMRRVNYFSDQFKRYRSDPK